MVIEQDGQDYSLGNERIVFQLRRTEPFSEFVVPACTQWGSNAPWSSPRMHNVDGSALLDSALEDVRAIGISPVVLSFDNIMPGDEATLR